MWRRVPGQLQALAASSWRSALTRSNGRDYLIKNRVFVTTLSRFSTNQPTSQSDVKKKVEDIMPIATGHEREELEAELEGRERFNMDTPVGPFGTKEAPAIVQSYYNKRIVGCPGGEGEDEHDVVWFWLEKDKPHECPVCGQYFMLEVIGEGGDPEGHGDEHH